MTHVSSPWWTGVSRGHVSHQRILLRTHVVLSADCVVGAVRLLSWGTFEVGTRCGARGRAMDSLIERIHTTCAHVVGCSSAWAMPLLRHARYEAGGACVESYSFDLIARELHETSSKLTKLHARVGFVGPKTWSRANIEYDDDGEPRCHGALQPLDLGARGELREVRCGGGVESSGLASPCGACGCAEGLCRASSPRCVLPPSAL